MPIQATIDNFSGPGTVKLWTWAHLVTGTPDGSPMQWAEFADRSVFISGTFGTGTCKIEGSNDGVTWQTIHDTSNTAISTTANTIRQALEVTKFVRPNVTGADGTTDLTVSMCVRRNWV